MARSGKAVHFCEGCKAKGTVTRVRRGQVLCRRCRAEGGAALSASEFGPRPARFRLILAWLRGVPLTFVLLAGLGLWALGRCLYCLATNTAMTVSLRAGQHVVVYPKDTWWWQYVAIGILFAGVGVVGTAVTVAWRRS